MSDEHNTPQYSTPAYTSENTPATGEWTQIPFEARPATGSPKPPMGFVRTPPEDPAPVHHPRRSTFWTILVTTLCVCSLLFVGFSLYQDSQSTALSALEKNNSDLLAQITAQSQELADLRLQLQAQSTQQSVMENSLDRLTQSVSEFTDIDPSVYTTDGATPLSGAGMTTSQIAALLTPSIVCVREIITSDAYNSLYGSWGSLQSSDVILSEGSGIVYSSGGKIITNYHVVESAYKGQATLEVLLSNGESVTASILGADELTDLALLQANATSLTPAKFGDSTELVIGDAAIAIGNPLGSELSGSVTAGIVSALDRVTDPTNPSMTYIQTDAAINPGNSGGALVNGSGEVVGINSWKISDTDVEGLGFAIPTSIALPVIEQLDEYGKVVGRAALELTAFDVTAILSWRYSCPEGIFVQSLSSALQEEGLQVSDIITQIDGRDAGSYADLVRLISTSYKAGDRVTLRLYRYQTVSRTFKEMEVSVTLTEAK